MDKLRIGIVGCGTISRLNVPGYLQHDGCEVTALCDSIPERAEQRSRDWGINPRIYTKYEDILDDREVDAIELLTPTKLHASQIVSGLEAGKHVSCQKPISNTVAEVEKIVDAIENSNTLFRITENFLFYPPILKAKELLEAGTIGEPSLVRIRTIRGNKTSEPGLVPESGAIEWRRDPSSNVGGMLYDDGWHKYATAMFWIGGIEKVFGMITKTEDFILETPSAVMWKFEGSDCLGTLDYVYASDMPIRGRYYPVDEFFEIIGSKGSIWVTRCTGEMLDMAPVILINEEGTKEYNVPSDWIEGFNGSAANFVDCVLRGEQPYMDVVFSKKVLQTALAIYQSSRIDRPVCPDSMI